MKAATALLLTMSALALVMVAAASSGGGEPRVHVEVIDQGFSYFGPSKLTYAFVLKNDSADLGLASGRYRVRFYDSLGGLLVERSGETPIALPGQEVAIAEEAVPVASQPTRMEVSLQKVAYEQVGAIPLLEKRTAIYLTGPRTTGGSLAWLGAFVTNPFLEEIRDVEVTAVFFDDAGHVLGGGSTSVPALAPGQQYVQVSLDNAPSVFAGPIVLYPAIKPVQLLAVRAAAQKLSGVPVTVAEVAWVAADPPLYTGRTTDHFDFWGTGKPLDWQVWEINGEDQARMLNRTFERAGGLRWAPKSNQLLVALQSATEARDFFLNGWLAIDPSDASVSWRALAITSPGPDSYRPGADRLRPAYLYPSPTGDRLLLQVGPSDPSPDTYVFAPEGPARRLEGIFRNVKFVDWLPDGSAFLGFSVEQSIAGQARGHLVLIPLGDGKVQSIDSPLIYDSHLPVAWSPDEKRLAFLVGADERAGDWSADLFIFDRASGATTQLTTSRPLPPERPAWSKGGTKVAVGGAMIDLGTLAIASPMPEGHPAIGGLVSPDGRYFVAAEVPFDRERFCPGPGLQNRLYRYGAQTSSSALLLDCDQGFHYITPALPNAAWLGDSRHLVLPTSNCWACGGTTIRISLVDVLTGELKVLVDDDRYLEARVSPDGRRVAVSGKALRIFDQDGNLIRQVDPPQGYAVREVAWSPDGTRLAYVLAPAWFVLPG